MVCRLGFASPKEGLEAGIGMLYQDPLDFPPFTILENYLLGKSRRFALDFKGAAKQVSQLAEQYGFEVDIRAEISSLVFGSASAAWSWSGCWQKALRC